METKRQGNEYFKQKNFDEAIKCYEEAIEWCPVDKHDELAIFHHNIAASYENMVIIIITSLLIIIEFQLYFVSDKHSKRR